MDYILTNGAHSFGTFALKVRGKSMEPEFKEGDTIIVDPDLCPCPWDYVVAKTVVNTPLLKIPCKGCQRKW